MDADLLRQLRRPRLGDVSTVLNTAFQLTGDIIKAVNKDKMTQDQRLAAAQCPPGYVFDYARNVCVAVQPAGGGDGGGFLSNIDQNTMLLIGGGALLLLVLAQR